ncbi:aminotransferase class III-fold pyridoxal phosphate-dependent enzyme [Stigmatella sp. ncwal1]|uniref:Aminotransferase class III-fold pyridoxal phosphate-dependent enzyme n=1 Tax=Stigmatella ashevillensis TaxID=2995309 RepID=A0ABT5DFT1_9BACT|nr:aminotransferase class III-fold pyridoxal phosphate-dependent enzyme [Stigmatella ashevillena]MDC0712525.1 aminotransferase class III-fold pyridoxal phosphate-dependent enzyme [Stigmatella ashevillena]
MKPERTRTQVLKTPPRSTQKASARVVGRAALAGPRKASRLKPVPEDRRATLEAYFETLFSQPWMQDVTADLLRRQPKSNERMTELRKHSVTNAGFWPFFSIFMPLCIEHAEGGRLYDIDGNEYLDCFLGFGAQSLHGHNPEPVVQFVKGLLGKSVGNGYASSLELEYVKLLKEFMPHCERFAFQNSGSDATTAAIRLARAHSGRRLVVRFEGSINGQYDVVSYNSHAALHGHPLLPYPAVRGPSIPLQSFNRGAQVLGKEDLLILTFNDPASLDIIKKRKNEIACVLTEPIPTAFPFPDRAIAFTRELGEVCRKSGVLLILDEVHSGFRYGPSGVTGFAHLHADLVTYGKVTTGLGLPLSAIGGRSDILELAATSGRSIRDYGQKTLLATTHINNHLSIAASYASLSLLKQKGEAFYTRTRQKAQRLQQRVGEVEVNSKVSLRLPGWGEFFGYMSFMRNQAPMNSTRDFIQATYPVANVVLALLLRRKGLYYHGVPYFYTGDAHSEQDLDVAVDKIHEAVAEMKQNHFSFDIPE